MLNNISFANPVTYLLIGALLVFVIARQVQARPLSVRALVAVPAVCLYFAFQQAPTLDHLDLAGWSFLLMSAAVGLVAGVARALTIRVWHAADGSAWSQGTWVTLAIWGAMIVFRIGSSVVAHFAAVPTNAMMAEILVMMGLTFGAQNAVVWVRSLQRVPAR